jgi:hypothetical protein
VEKPPVHIRIVQKPALGFKLASYGAFSAAVLSAAPSQILAPRQRPDFAISSHEIFSFFGLIHLNRP